MKKFLILFVNLGVVAFTMAAVGTFLNAFLGLSIGYGGSKLPNDPIIGVVFLCVAAVFGAAAFFVNRRNGAA